jgi:hypothetical protein
VPQNTNNCIKVQTEIIETVKNWWIHLYFELICWYPRCCSKVFFLVFIFNRWLNNNIWKKILSFQDFKLICVCVSVDVDMDGSFPHEEDRRMVRNQVRISMI